MKIIGLLFLGYLILGTVGIIIRVIIGLLRGEFKSHKSIKENYGYPYYGFNNPFMDGFE